MQLTDLLKVSSENSVLALLIGLIVAIGLYYFVRLVKLIISKIESSSDVILTVGKSLTNDKGEPVKHFDSFRAIHESLNDLKNLTASRNEKCDRHYESMEHYIQDTKFCDVDTCPHMVKLVEDLKLLAEKFDQFDRRANESRVATGASLDEVKSQMQILASEISQQSKQMVQVLTDLLVGRKNIK